MVLVEASVKLVLLVFLGEGDVVEVGRSNPKSEQDRGCSSPSRQASRGMDTFPRTAILPPPVFLPELPCQEDDRARWKIEKAGEHPAGYTSR